MTSLPLSLPLFSFFTVTLRDSCSDALVRHIGLLRNAFRTVRAERPFTIDAIVILPDHLHAVWTLPNGDADYSERWRSIKSNPSGTGFVTPSLTFL